MMTSEDVADAIVWMLSRPDHVLISELVMHNTLNPWASA
jgi:NADP-dependent 3-hydroxy acid dehydrogenase YdfG